MPQPDLPFEGGIKIDATRLKPAFVLAFWRQNGANCRCFLTSGAKTEPISCETSSHHPTATFEPPKRYWFWDFLKILFERRLCWQRETVLSSPFYLRTATWRAKKRHGFSKNLSTKLPKPAPLKKRHLFFAFLLRWSAVADSGVIFSALSSTPVPQHPKPKSKHRIEIFFEKPSIPVPQHRTENFQHQLQKCCECPSLSYRNIGGQKTTSILKVFRKVTN